MNKQAGYVEAIIAIIVVAAFIGLIVFLGTQASGTCANNACASSPASTAPSTPAERPLTKVECDWTGFMGEQMIADNAADGYRYTGRTTTFFCDNALAFERKD